MALQLAQGERFTIASSHNCTYNQCPQGNLAGIDTRLVLGSVYSRGVKAPSYMMRHVHANRVKCDNRVAKMVQTEKSRNTHQRRMP